MPLFRRRKPAESKTATRDHAVITHLPLSGDGFGTTEERNAVHELEARIGVAVERIGGDHDGDEFGGGEAVLYTYGVDADQLFDAISECLADFEMRTGAYAIKRYGPATDPNSREERVPLT
jgi:hypothetical protein